MKKNHLLTLLLALAVLGSVLTGILIAGAAEGTGYAFESFGQDVTDKHAIEIAESATAGVRIGFGGEFDAVSLGLHLGHDRLQGCSAPVQVGKEPQKNG